LRRLAVSIAAIPFVACLGGPTLEAHLAVDPNRSSASEPRFSGCAQCPTLEYILPTGVAKPIVVSVDPLYVIRPRDIERLDIYESRSPEVLGVRSYLVVAHPSKAWQTKTEAVRDSYPYDSIAWLEADRPIVLTHNVNRLSQGAYWLAVFACEGEALKFARRMGHPAPVTRQSEEEYQAEVERINASNAKTLEMLRSNPKDFSRIPGLSPSAAKHLVSEGLPQFPVSLDAYYGPGHALPKCEQ
jgi:hypothetical protein